MKINNIWRAIITVNDPKKNLKNVRCFCCYFYSDHFISYFSLSYAAEKVSFGLHVEASKFHVQMKVVPNPVCNKTKVCHSH